MYRIRSNPRSPAWLLVAALLVAASLGLVRAALWSPQSFALATMVAVVSVATPSAARWWRYARALAEVRRARRLLLVGAGPMAQHLARCAEEQGWQVLGCVEDAARAAAVGLPAPLLGSRSALPRLAGELAADRLIVTDAAAETWELLGQLGPDELACEVYVVPGPYELALCPASAVRLGDVALLRLPSRRAPFHYRFGKRLLDVGVSGLLLLLFGPVLAMAMAAIRLTSRGTALFRQERVGLDGGRIEILKLRTMVEDAERDGPQLCAGTGDPRLTPLGRFLRKTHLDELPQLWNVLRGEMSLVGPRPERPNFVEQFEREVPAYGERHRVLPGITGLAQVYGSYHSLPREKLRFDLMYLYHRSLGMDLWILARTLLAVFQ